MAAATVLLDEADRQTYAELTCSARQARDSVFWWLSDPSLLIPGNDRLTEHTARAVGNRILRQYRGAAYSVGRIAWYAGLIPRSDSIRWFNEYQRWVTHPSGIWRWHDELTRFGSSNAIDVIPGTKKAPTVEYRDGKMRVEGVRTDGCSPTGYYGQRCEASHMVCPLGYEPREMSINPNDLTEKSAAPRSVPAKDDPHADFYPSQVFARYGWSVAFASGCTRIYNTKARYEFTPFWRVTADPFAIAPYAWQMGGDHELAGGPPYREQYTPTYAPVTAIDDFQIARLPRGDSMLVLAVMHSSGDGLDVSRTRAGTGKWEAGLIATSRVPPRPDARDMVIVRVQSESFTPRQVLIGTMPTTSIFTALEILTPDTVGFARTRSGLAISPWLEGPNRMSDIVLFRPDSNWQTGGAITMASLESVLPRALTSLSVPRGEELGLYWETQLSQVPSGMSEATVSLSIERLDQEPAFLGRVLRGLFGGADIRSRGVRWKTAVPAPGAEGGVRWGNSVSIPTNSLEPGQYVLAIEVAGTTGTLQVAKRSLTVVRVRR